MHVLLNSFVTLPLAKVGALRFQHVKKEGSSAFFTRWNQRNPTFPHDCTSGGALISLALPFIFVCNHYHHFIIVCCVSLCNHDAILVRSLVYVCACIRTSVIACMYAVATSITSIHFHSSAAHCCTHPLPLLRILVYTARGMCIHSIVLPGHVQ